MTFRIAVPSFGEKGAISKMEICHLSRLPGLERTQTFRTSPKFVVEIPSVTDRVGAFFCAIFYAPSTDVASDGAIGR
jgi:hypothetical protein